MKVALHKWAVKRFVKGRPDQNWVVVAKRGERMVVVKHGTHGACSVWIAKFGGSEEVVRMERRGR